MISGKRLTIGIATLFAGLILLLWPSLSGPSLLSQSEIVQAQVLNIDPENRRLSLGMKQLQEDAWETFSRNYHVGDVVHGKVVRKATFGVFVELAEGIEGLCHVSEFATEVADKHAIPMEIGQEDDFKIIKMNAADRKIGLSLKALQPQSQREEKPERNVPAHTSPTATNTIGDMMAMKERNSLKK